MLKTLLLLTGKGRHPAESKLIDRDVLWRKRLEKHGRHIDEIVQSSN